MALQGTLKDFGIADILQLIGQQQKTGVLIVRSKDQEVEVGFREGSIVKAESATRKKKDLIGTMLVRAELLTEAQLEQALETQRRTLKRLGDVLIGMELIPAERFRAMVQLQFTETLYGLFQWKSGTYEFRQEEFEHDPEFSSPLRAESILMEGFRMVDEWPVVKKTITSYELSFEKRKALPSAKPRSHGEEEGPSEFKRVGEHERQVYGLVQPGRDVRKLIDLSLLGEFETCKALYNLVSLGHLDVVEPSGKLHAVGGTQPLLERMGPLLARVATMGCIVLLIAFMGSRMKLEGGMNLARPGPATFADPAVQRFLSRTQLSRISAALDVYRLEKGELPQSLQELVTTGLLQEGDLRHPWQEPYHYRRVAGAEFVLLPPLR